MADLLYKEREYVPARQYYDLFAQGGGQNARSLLLGIRLAKVSRTATRPPAMACS